MGIRIDAGRDASVEAGRDINVGEHHGPDELVLERIYGLLEDAARRTGQHDVAAETRQEVEGLVETEDEEKRAKAMDRVMELAKSLGPSVVTVLGQLLPRLFT